MRQERRHAEPGIGRQHALHRRDRSGAFFVGLQLLKQALPDLKAQRIGDDHDRPLFGKADIFVEKVGLPNDAGIALRSNKLPVPIHRHFVKIFVGVYILDQIAQPLKRRSIVRLIEIVIEIPIAAVDLIPAPNIVVQNIFQPAERRINAHGEQMPCIFKHEVCASFPAAEMLLPPLLADGGDRFVSELCPRVLVFEPLGDPSDQNIINAGKDTAIDDILRRHFGENRLAAKGAVNALGDLIETLAVKIAVHQVIQKGDDVARFIRHKRSPRLRHIGMNGFGDIGHEHRDNELFQGRFVILIPENAVRLLPKRIQQIILFKFGKIGILLQLAVGQQAAHHFF